MIKKFSNEELRNLYKNNTDDLEVQKILEILKIISKFILTEQFITRKNNKQVEKAKIKIGGKIKILVELDMEKALYDLYFFRRVYKESQINAKKLVIKYPPFMNIVKNRNTMNSNELELKRYKKEIERVILTWLERLNYHEYQKQLRFQKRILKNQNPEIKFLIPVKLNLEQPYSISELLISKNDDIFFRLNQINISQEKDVNEIDSIGNPKPQKSDDIIYCGWNKYYDCLKELFENIEFNNSVIQRVGVNKKVILACLDGNDNRYSQANSHILNISGIKESIHLPEPDIVYVIDKLKDFFSHMNSGETIFGFKIDDSGNLDLSKIYVEQSIINDFSFSFAIKVEALKKFIDDVQKIYNSENNVSEENLKFKEEHEQINFESYLSLLLSENQEILFLYNKETLKNIIIKYDKVRMIELERRVNDIIVLLNDENHPYEQNLDKIIEIIKSYYREEKKKIRNSRFHKYDMGDSYEDYYELSNKRQNANYIPGELTTENFCIKGPIQNMRNIFNLIIRQQEIINNINSNINYKIYIIHSFLEYAELIISDLELKDKINNEKMKLGSKLTSEQAIEYIEKMEEFSKIR